MTLTMLRPHAPAQEQPAGSAARRWHDCRKMRLCACLSKAWQARQSQADICEPLINHLRAPGGLTAAEPKQPWGSERYHCETASLLVLSKTCPSHHVQLDSNNCNPPGSPHMALQRGVPACSSVNNEVVPGVDEARPQQASARPRLQPLTHPHRAPLSPDCGRAPAALTPVGGPRNLSP